MMNVYCLLSEILGEEKIVTIRRPSERWCVKIEIYHNNRGADIHGNPLSVKRKSFENPLKIL